METLLTACPADLIPADDRQLIIRDLLLDLHDKVSHMEDGITAFLVFCWRKYFLQNHLIVIVRNIIRDVMAFTQRSPLHYKT